MAALTTAWSYYGMLLLMFCVGSTYGFNEWENKPTYIGLTTVMVIIVVFLGTMMIFMFKYSIDMCTLFKLFRTNFLDICLCRLKKEDIHNGKLGDKRVTSYEDGETFGELPPPRNLQTTPDSGRDVGGIPTESMLDLRAMANTSSSEEDSEDEEEQDIDKDPPQPTPSIAVDEFIRGYGSKKVNQAKLKQEFDLLSLWSKLIMKNRNHSKLEMNKAKNRYYDIVPYNYNRVPLYDVEGLKGNKEYVNLNKKDRKKMGYINASYIHEYGSNRAKYIAAQGPLDRTLRDFWQMVWQEGSQVIVMLTSLREQGRVKCERYWPKNKGDRLDFGEIKIKLEVSQCYAFYDYRVIIVEKDSVRRPVHHYLYHHWPDKEAPEMVVPVLDLYHKIFKSDHEIKNPLVVHCSAGVGRTGTFISIDYLLSQAAKMARVDVAKCVYELRRQRVSMVQKVSQYMFVYEAIHEALEAKQTSMSAACFRDWYEEAKDERPSIIDKHFEMVRAKVPNMQEDSEGLRDDNLDKNRDNTIIPIDAKRPFLITYMKGRNSYVNAVYVDTFLETEAIIATQCPTSDTIDDFWRLVYDRSCAAVLLLEPNDESYPVYWPKDNKVVVYGNALKVSGFLNKKLSTDTVCVRNYTVILSQQPEYVVDVKLLQLKTWPRGRSTPPDKMDLVDLMGLWKKFRRQSSIVQCYDGSAKSGLFCACAYLVDQIQTDHQADIYHACRMITSSRPSFISSREQYRFLHEFAIEYIESFGDYSNFAKPGTQAAPRERQSNSWKDRLSFQVSKKREPPRVKGGVSISETLKETPDVQSRVSNLRSSSKASRHSMPATSENASKGITNKYKQRASMDTVMTMPIDDETDTDADVYINMANVKSPSSRIASQNGGVNCSDNEGTSSV